MHELPAVTELINTLEAERKKNGLGRISKVTMVIGELSSMEEECIRSYFELLSEGRCMEGAGLEFIKTFARLKCPQCGNEFEHRESFNCPSCGKGGILIKGSGRDFAIKSIEGE